MQYLGNVRSLPCRWQFASNLLLAAAALTTTTTCTRSSSSLFAVSSSFTHSQQNSRKMSEKTCDDDFKAGRSSVAFVTTPDKESAKKLAHGLIQLKLAACVNIVSNIESIYMWEGKVNEDNEYLMMIKTRSSRIEELSKFVRENHPYSVAEVISLPIEDGNLPYLKWITQTVPEKAKSQD